MSLTIIIKEGTADRRRRIYEDAKRNPRYNGPIEGITRSVDEANDIAYHRHGEIDKPFAIEGDVPEMKQAHEDQMLRVGRMGGVDVDPDRRYREWQNQEAEQKK